MNYSKTAVKTLPFLGKCLIFAVLCFNLFYLMPIAPPSLTTAEFGVIVALSISFLPVRVTSFMFLAVAELSVFYLIYDGFFVLSRLFLANEAFLRYTLDGMVVPLLCAAHLLYGAISAHRVAVTRYSLTTERPLPGGGMRILQLSDVHPARFFSKGRIDRLRGIVREAKPDMIVLTGDIFDEFTRPASFDEFCRFLTEVEPRYGIWYVFGNHDADWHWRRPDHTADDIRRRFAEAGVGILEDEGVVLCGGQLRVVGRRDANEERLTPEELLLGHESFEGYTVLLCHEPVELSECARCGADVTFAGHTHGGQVFPLGLLMKYAVKSHEMNSGIRELEKGRYAIVSCGVGTWGYPIRTEGKNELILADVRQGG